MPRPRLHTIDELLDVAERLVTDGGRAGLTLRSLAAASGASNGTIYHAFRSKDDLLAHLWLRAADRLGSIMDAETAAGDAADAVVAVALSPLTLAARHPRSAELYFTQSREQLLSTDLPPETLDRLGDRQRRFTRLLIALAEGMWGRTDAVAVEAIAACVVDIPGGLVRRQLLTADTLDDATADRIEASVRAVLPLPVSPPHAATRGSDHQTEPPAAPST